MVFIAPITLTSLRSGLEFRCKVVESYSTDRLNIVLRSHAVVVTHDRPPPAEPFTGRLCHLLAGASVGSWVKTDSPGITDMVSVLLDTGSDTTPALITVIQLDPVPATAPPIVATEPSAESLTSASLSVIQSSYVSPTPAPFPAIHHHSLSCIPDIYPNCKR